MGIRGRAETWLTLTCCGSAPIIKNTRVGVCRCSTPELPTLRDIEEQNMCEEDETVHGWVQERGTAGGCPGGHASRGRPGRGLSLDNGGQTTTKTRLNPSTVDEAGVPRSKPELVRVADRCWVGVSERRSEQKARCIWSQGFRATLLVELMELSPSGLHASQWKRKPDLRTRPCRLVETQR